jgi:hypothetical protein
LKKKNASLLLSAVLEKEKERKKSADPLALCRLVSNLDEFVFETSVSREPLLSLIIN